MRTSLAAKHSLLIGALVAEAGKLELESVCFDLPDMVEEVVDLLAGQARSKNLELACFVGDGVPSTIRADLGRLRQILVNLVGNAVKFTDRGEVMVWVTLTRSPSAATRQGEEEPPGSPTWLQLAVTDTGVGVPESQKDQIFESFTQADGTMARRFGGTGLGLAICTQLVDLMAGEIGFESEESRGSRFWIRIPVEVASQPDPETAPALSNFDGLRAHPLPEATVEAEATAEAEGEVLAHVLVAEDNEVNQQVVIAFLESLDCRVDAVANGQEAVDQLERSSSYDLVFMDCQMPTMDGFAATRAIRAREAEAAQAEGGAPMRRLPIVALTAHAMSSDREDCLAAGMDDYLTKPFTKADLAGAIDRAKQQDWAAGQAPAESERPDPPPSAHPVPGASVDPTPLRRLAATFKGDGSKVIARVVNTFLASSQKLLSAIRDSVEADDPKALVSAAHTLKSSSAQMGAQGLSNLCKQLEALGRGGSCEGARELANRIFEEFESVQEGLAAENFGNRAPTPAMDRKGAASHPLLEATVEAETTAEAEGEVLAHVLVVEDNEVNQQVVIAVLESLDCRVDVVANGQEAVDQLERSSSYDLVFMDCQMPTMDGFAATRAIRAREAEAAQAEGGAPMRRLPIVALTAHAMSSDREDCLAAGMDDYLTKPFTKADLAGAIDRAKQQHWAAGQAPAESERPDPPPSAHPVPGASVDLAPLRRLAATSKGDGSKVIARVVNTFLASSQKLLSAIRDSVEADDPKALVSVARTLKSSSAQVGAQGLSNLCKQLEALGRGGSCEGARELANRISEEFESVQEGLAAEDFGARDG